MDQQPLDLALPDNSHRIGATTQFGALSIWLQVGLVSSPSKKECALLQALLVRALAETAQTQPASQCQDPQP